METEREKNETFAVAEELYEMCTILDNAASPASDVLAWVCSRAATAYTTALHDRRRCPPETSALEQYRWPPHPYHRPLHPRKEKPDRSTARLAFKILTKLRSAVLQEREELARR